MASISLSNWKPVEQSQIQFVGVLVSGITASSSTSSLNLTASFVASLGLLSVVFNYESAVSVQLVAVSYFILKSSSLSLVMTKDATLSWTYSLQGAIPTKAVNQAYLSIGIFPDRLVCIGSQCPASCISTPDCSKAKGIALKINFTCLICEPKEEYVSALGKCFCNNLSYKNNDVCISCWDNSLANP